MNKYLVSYNVVYRVPTVDDVLELREELSDLPNGKLESFSYAEKYIKEFDGSPLLVGFYAE